MSDPAVRQRRPVHEDDRATGGKGQGKRMVDPEGSTSSSSFGKVVFFLFIAVVVTVVLCIVFIPAPIYPVEIELKPPPYFNGTLEPNTELRRATRLFENEIIGPESLVYRDGNIFTGTHDGRILRIDSNNKIHELARIGVPPCGRLRDEPNCGRPLGMRFDVTGYLIVADAYLGLHKVDMKTGETIRIVDPDKPIKDHVPVFFNDFDFARDGSIYFSDSSTRWDRRHVPNIFLEGMNDGRLLQLNRRTGEVNHIMGDLYFANGIQVSHDKTFLLIAETTKCRILRYDLEGWKKTSYTIFADNLPGLPDNIRLSSTGGYWVSFARVRQGGKFSIYDYLATRPWIRKWISKIFDPWTATKFFTNYGLIVEYDNDGKPVRSLHDPTGEVISGVSEVLDVDGTLYLGSYNEPYLGKLDIRQLNEEFMKQKAKESKIVM